MKLQQIKKGIYSHEYYYNRKSKKYTTIYTSYFRNQTHCCKNILIILKNDKNIDEEKYDKSFETNLGEIRYPSFYEMMLDKDNLIDYLPNSYGLYLKSEAGIITPQVKLLEIEY